MPSLPKPVSNSAHALWHFIRQSRYLIPTLCLLATATLVILRLLNWHEKRLFNDEMLAQFIIREDMNKNWHLVGLLYLQAILPYIEAAAALFAVPLHVAILRAWPHASRLVGVAWRCGILLAIWGVARDAEEHLAHLEITISGEPATPWSYGIKLGMIVLAAIVPAIAFTFYARSKLLVRYTLRNFIGPTVFCFIAFCSLWMLMDLIDSLKDFQEARTPLGKILLFYLNMVPFIFVSVAPAAILLGVLYSLSKMSRSNEIVSMLGVGRSVAQILAPIFSIALLMSLLSMAANYHWAPRSEGNRRAIMRALTEGEAGTIMAEGLMFRNEDTKRTWYAGSFPFNLRDEKIRNIELRQEDANGKLERTWLARSATWWSTTGQWRFYHGQEIIYENGEPVKIIDFTGRQPDSPSRIDVSGIEETPWSIVSSALVPDYMAVPEIVAYLQTHQNTDPAKLLPFRTHLYHRTAFPFQCFVLALMAAPLGIAYSRRGSLSGIAASIFIFFGMIFINDLFINLGKGGHLPPAISVWTPNAAFALIGLILLYFKSRNRELPKLSFKKAFVARARNRETHATQAASS